MALSSSSKTGEQFLFFNDQLVPAGQPILSADNRGFRYGDGLFETMLVEGGQIRLESYHFERLLPGMRLLGFSIPEGFEDRLRTAVQRLCEVNGHVLARVRLTIFRGDGLLFDPVDGPPNSIIQSSPLIGGAPALDAPGLRLTVFPDGRKACDAFSHLKTNSCLVYTMAAQYARQQGADDCLVLNGYGRLADSTVANLFFIRGGKVYTPSLEEGAVAGVFRRCMLEFLTEKGYEVYEQPVSLDELYSAEEVFLTNAIRGIRWVRSLHDVVYSNLEVLGIIRNFYWSNNL